MQVKTNYLFILGIAMLLSSFTPNGYESKITRFRDDVRDTANDRQQIGSLLDSFNAAAARADYDGYFKYFTDDAVFIGTDATEYWNKKDFMVWSKPYFDKKQTWDFKSIRRNIYFGKNNDIAWFDELLNTQMKICRGSGVVVKQNDQWKIQQYVLSMTIPNSQVRPVIKIKAPEEDSLINKLSLPK